jgi:WD40 repeat protein
MEVNDVIKSYRLVEVLGEGGFGKVFKARHDTIDREVAMKVILPLHANQPEFIERFELEAQLVARLEHPNIVPLYDFWRDPHGAYLVMRLIRGGSLVDAILQANLTNEYWDIERAAKLLDQIASALHTAHRNKIVHQDIKPANILLDEDGNAYLTDFGIARVLDSDINLAQDANNVMHGSPKYISPEHLKRAEITPKSDIYSLGLLMYEVLTGDPPYDSTELLELLQMHLKRRIPPLQEKRPDLPDELNAPLRQATTRNPDERYASVLDFARDFNGVVQQLKYGGTPVIVGAPNTNLRSGGVPGDEVLVNPYKGLAAFQESDAADFYGRSALIETLLTKVIDKNGQYNRLLAVVGPSGSGKSSVVRAGVIPKIRAGAIAGMTFYTATMIPGTNPMRSLEGAVLRVASRASDDFLKKIGQPNFDLMEVLEMSMPKTGEMLLIIDQFEEVFTLADDKTIRDHFLKTVHDAITHPQSRVRVIITMRADFTGHALQERYWGEMIHYRTTLVPTMTINELREAIEEPARRVGLHFQDGLLEQIISDVNVQSEFGSLPLLQYTLSELFDKHKGRELTRDAYRELGGISGALAKRADETYLSLEEEQQLLAQRIFPRLITLGEGVQDTRRREFLGNLYSMHPNTQMVDEVLLAFQNGHLIARSYDELTRDIVIEVAHEALIRQWSRLRKWLDENRDALRLQASLSVEVRQWVGAGKSADFLARGDRLASFRQLFNNNLIALSAVEHEYLVASDNLEKQYQRRRQQFIAALAVAAVVSAIAAIIATFFWQQSVVAERTAVAERNNANTQESIANAQSTIAYLNEQDAISERDRANIQSTLAYLNEQDAITERDRANQQSILSRSRELAASALLFTASQPDRAVLFSLQAINTSSTYEARNALLTALQTNPSLNGYFNGHTAEVRAVVLNPDKTLLASGARNGEIIIWDMATRRPIQHLTHHSDRVNTIAFNSDGTLMASTGYNGQLAIWDTSTWQIRHDLTWTDTASNAVGWGLTFAPDGSTLALGDNLGQLYLWNAVTGEVQNNFQAHTDAIYALAFSPDSSTLATGGGDNLVKIWDNTTFEPIAEFADHTNWILDLAFRSDGLLLASASADTNIRFWNMQTLQGIGGLIGHTNGVRSIMFTSDGQRLISADQGGTIIITDLTNRENDFTINSPEHTPVWSMDLRGSDLLVGGETDSIFMVSLSSTATFPFNRNLGNTSDTVNRVVFSPDSTLVAAGGGSNTNFDISVWHLETGAVQVIDNHNNIVNDMVWHDNRLISVDIEGLVVISESGTVRTFQNKGAVISVGAYGDTLALGDAQGNITLWNMGSDPLERIIQFDAHDGPILALSFSPDGTQLVSGGRDSTLTLWDVNTRERIGDMWRGHTDDVLTVTFSPDGRFVASGSRDNTIIIWDVTTGQAVSEPLIGHTNFVTGLAYNPDGTVLVSSSHDMTVRLWDMTVFRQLGLPLRRHTAVINTVDYSVDGKWIASASQSGVVALWNADLTYWTNAACTFANRPLSANERQEFFAGDFPAVNICPLDTDTN